MNKKKLFNYTPYINNSEKKFIHKAIKSKEISTYGKLNHLFEKKISKIINLKYTTSVTSGSVALFIAFKVLEIQHKDIVITSTYTFVSTINSIIHSGGTPYIIDIDEKDYCMDLDRLEQLLNNNSYKKNGFYYDKKTNCKFFAICPVYFNGVIPDYKKIKKIARKYKLKIVTDAAAALCSLSNNKEVAKYSDLVIISYNGNKTITCGGGGTISTNNMKLFKKTFNMVTNFTSKKKYFHTDNGFNFRLTNLHASIGLAQLTKMKKIIDKIKLLCNTYKKNINKKKFKILEFKDTHMWKYLITCKSLLIKREVIRKLKKKGINQTDFWVPMNKQVFKKRLIIDKILVANKIYDKVLTLPLNFYLQDNDIKKITKIINRV
jgi:perosamine synthetase